MRFALSPDADPLQQCSRGIKTRIADAQNGIQMKVRIDEGRRHEISRRIQFLRGFARNRGRYFGEFSAFNSDIPKSVFVRELGPTNDHIHVLLPQTNPYRSFYPQQEKQPQPQ